MISWDGLQKMVRISKKRFIEESQRIFDAFENEITVFNDNQTEQKKRKEKASLDIFYFIKTYLPHYAETKTFPGYYNEIDRWFTEDTFGTICSLAAPRGFSKSTYFFARVIHAICYKTVKFIVYVSATRELAADFVNFAKMELEQNSRIKQDFGDLLNGTGQKCDFVANKVRVFSRTLRQMVRGFKFRNHRPDWILIDDVERDTDATSPVTIKKFLKVIKEGLFPSLRPSKESKFFIFGTIISKRSALGTILLSQEEPYCYWKRRIFKSIYFDELANEERSLWEERFPLETLRKIKETIGSISFNKEYQNNPEDEGINPFQEQWFLYYDIKSVNVQRLIKAIFVDPSARSEKKNDYKAIITVGLDIETMIFYVLNSWIKRTSIGNMLQATFRLYREFLPMVVGFESNGFQALLKELYEQMEKEQKINLPLKLIEHTLPKELRILKTSPILERGKIKFLNNSQDDTKLLIEQMIFFPSTQVNDDGPDALAECVNILNNCQHETSFTSNNIFKIIKTNLFTGFGFRKEEVL